MSLLDYTYFDNNATTIMPQSVLDTMVKCANLGNPSGLYKLAEFSQDIIKRFRAEIAEVCEFPADDYMILFNSGATESNNHIINATVNAYTKEFGIIPHIIVSDVEHSSLMQCVEKLEGESKIELTKIKTYIRPIEPHELHAHIKKNTALISIMAANNETGIINDLVKLKEVAPGIPFHTDATQYLGKLQFKLRVDAFSASFHKLHGPKGCGILVIRKSFIESYKMCAFICGSQNYGQRGGTEAIHNIAASLAAFRYSINNLEGKAIYIAKLRAKMMVLLGRKFPCSFIDANNGQVEPNLSGVSLVIIQPKRFDHTLPNTILLAVNRVKICNKAIRKALEEQAKIIVGLGSACSKGSVSVVKTLGIPEHLWPGVLRISLSDMNTEKEIIYFVEQFSKIIVSDSVLLVDQ